MIQCEFRSTSSIVFCFIYLFTILQGYSQECVCENSTISSNETINAIPQLSNYPDQPSNQTVNIVPYNILNTTIQGIQSVSTPLMSSLITNTTNKNTTLSSTLSKQSISMILLFVELVVYIFQQHTQCQF